MERKGKRSARELVNADFKDEKHDRPCLCQSAKQTGSLERHSVTKERRPAGASTKMERKFPRQE